MEEAEVDSEAADEMLSLSDKNIFPELKMNIANYLTFYLLTSIIT